MEVEESESGAGEPGIGRTATRSDGPDDPEQSTEARDVPTQQVVEFRLGRDDCAVDIHEVDSIVEMTEVTRIPRTPDAVDGVMDLRGETTAIIDPRAFLGVEGESPDREDQDVLVLDRPDDKQKVGIRVDEVMEVSTYPEDRIDTGDDLSDLETRGVERAVSRGIIRKPNGEGLDLVVWLDVDAVIDQLR